ncbi:hypothetical protein BDR03DRAFT_1087600 [Suillus americanus]|nr:hypothetical protein BDR03DRAFT_1087600 [Suillus americanus]
MHPALRIFEVIDIISSHTEHGSLPALASTCRAFESPALNVLWRNLQSVEPLVKCLPSDLFGIDREGLVLQKPLDHKMWDTLSRYTSYVRSITQPGNSTSIEPLGLILLSCPLAPASLFPKLCRLTWHADVTRGATEFLRMAFVPSLLSLSLNVHISSASPAFLPVFSSLGTLCPRLHSMNLRSSHLHPVDAPSPNNSPFIIQPISQLHHLRNLEVWDLGIQGIQQIMLLRALQKLTLDFRASSSSAWSRRLPSQLLGFQNLHLLCLTADAFERPSNFLSSLTIVRTKKVAVYFDVTLAVSPIPVLSQFLAILQEKCDNRKLEYFAFIAISKLELWMLTKSDIFVSLRAFSNLTHLDIERGCAISISDEELCYLTGAWPKLQVLRISCFVTVDWDTTAVPTFHGLIRILRLCPALISLALVIDTTKLDDIDLRNPGGENFYSHLKDLSLGNSVIDSPLNVAFILGDLFPHLEQVDLDCWDVAPMSSLAQKELAMEQWASVNGFLRGYRVDRGRSGHIVT